MLECSTTGMLSCWGTGMLGYLGSSTTGMLGRSSAGLLPTLPGRVLFRATRSPGAARRFGRSSAPGAVRVPLAPPRTARRAAAPLLNPYPPSRPIKPNQTTTTKSTNPKTGEKKKTKLSLKSDTTPHGMTQAAIPHSGGLLAFTPALTLYGMQRMRTGCPQRYGMCGQCPQLIPGCLRPHQLYLRRCSQ